VEEHLSLAPHAPLREHSALPADGSEAGQHRVGLVGIRALDGVTVDDQGEIQLSTELMVEIERFDLGTQSTIAVVGSNESGGFHTALRVVPLVPIAPWWTLWLILAGLVLVGFSRYRGWLSTRSQRLIGSLVVAASAVPAVVLGWLSTVTVVVWWAIGLGLIAAVMSWLVPVRLNRSRARQKA